MPDHKTNPTAVLNSMLPELLPVGHGVLVQLHIRVVPGAGVLPYPAECIREVEGGVEIQDQHTGNWFKPEGVRLVHPIGKPFAPENCDVVIMLGTSVQDGLQRGLISAAGARPQFNTSHVMHGELLRMPLVEWQKQHLGQLRGPVE